VTLSTFLQPTWFGVLLVWCFIVLAAAQLTIRLIMAFSIRTTIIGAVVLALLALPVAAAYDLLLPNSASLTARLNTMWVPMLLMGLAGFATARWVLRIKRLRGQIVAAIMIGALDPHLFALLSS
jgi:hypothetical protein